MPKVYCAAIDCEFYNDGKCKAKTVSLSWSSIMTKWDGRQEFNKCKTYQESKASKELKEKFAQLYNKSVKEFSNETD